MEAVLRVAPNHTIILLSCAAIALFPGVQNAERPMFVTRKVSLLHAHVRSAKKSEQLEQGPRTQQLTDPNRGSLLQLEALGRALQGYPYREHPRCCGTDTSSGSIRRLCRAPCYCSSVSTT